jgi:hypothetical protein
MTSRPGSDSATLPRRAGRLGGDPVRSARVAGLALIATFVAARLVRVHGPGGFVVAGSQFVHPGAPGGLRLTHAGGYDGQFVYRLALDPFTRQVTDFGITLDNPAYRQQRIATPVLAHVVAWLPGVGTALALILVNALALAVAVFAGTRIAADAGRHPGWGLVLAAPACMPISLGRDLTEPVAWAAILVALLLVRRGHWPAAAGALTVAVLARETSLLVVAGLGIGAGWHAVRTHRREWSAAWLLVPVAIEAAWQGWLRHVWGGFPIRTGQSHNTSTLPVLGVLRSVVSPGGGSARPALEVVYTLERLAILVLIVVAAWVLWRRRSGVSAGEAMSWLLASLLALSVQKWVNDVQFLRATYEAWGLCVLVLMYARERTARYLLGAAGATTLCVALMYVARV